MRCGDRLEVDALFGCDARLVGVLGLSHLGHGVGNVDQRLRGVAARDHHVDVVRPGSDRLDDIVRVGLYLTDLGEFSAVNAAMEAVFDAPYPARSTIEVSALPRGAKFEVDAIMVLR